MHLDSAINSLLYDAKESENVKQAVAHVVKKMKHDGDGDRSDGDARSRNSVGNRSRAMTSNLILHLMATEKDINPTTKGTLMSII